MCDGEREMERVRGRLRKRERGRERERESTFARKDKDQKVFNYFAVIKSVKLKKFLKLLKDSISIKVFSSRWK